MDKREAIEILKTHMKKFTQYPRYSQAVDEAIKALENEMKRIVMIDLYNLEANKHEYKSGNYRYWRDLAEALEDCEMKNKEDTK